MKTLRFALALFSVLSAAESGFATPFATQAALVAAQTATNELDNSWTPKYSNLKGYWRMNGKVGAIASGFAVKDYFSSGSDAICTGAGTSFAAGRLEQGIVFDGNRSFNIPQASQANICNNITVMLWVKWNAPNTVNWTTLVGNWNGCSGNGWYIQQGGTSKTLEISLNTTAGTNQTLDSVSAPLDGNWHHVALTLSSGGAINLYIDGALDKSGTYSPGTGVCSSSAPISIGGALCGTTLQSGAMLDELAIFNSVLTLSDIQTIYNRQKNGVR